MKKSFAEKKSFSPESGLEKEKVLVEEGNVDKMCII